MSGASANAAARRRRAGPPEPPSFRPSAPTQEQKRQVIQAASNSISGMPPSSNQANIQQQASGIGPNMPGLTPNVGGMSVDDGERRVTPMQLLVTHENKITELENTLDARIEHKANELIENMKKSVLDMLDTKVHDFLNASNSQLNELPLKVTTLEGKLEYHITTQLEELKTKFTRLTYDNDIQKLNDKFDRFNDKLLKLNEQLTELNTITLKSQNLTIETTNETSKIKEEVSALKDELDKSREFQPERGNIFSTLLQGSMMMDTEHISITDSVNVSELEIDKLPETVPETVPETDNNLDEETVESNEITISEEDLNKLFKEKEDDVEKVEEELVVEEEKTEE